MVTHMLRIMLALPALLIVSVRLIDAQQEIEKGRIDIAKLAGNVYMLTGQGGNIAADIGEDGIVIVDDQYAPLAEKIQAALKGITDKPIRFVINTHFHDDHTNGNEYFQKQAPVIAHDNVRKRLESNGISGNRGSLAFPSTIQPKDTLPILTFDHDVTIHLNGEDIHVMHVQNGHTDGDSVVYFPKSNVVHMGDDYLSIGFPFVDLSAGGSVLGLIAALEEIMPRLPADVKVIPGHGAVSTLNDMRTFVTMLKETRAVVERGCKQGKSLEQLKREDVLGPWKQWAGPFITSDIYLETLYNDVTGRSGSLVKPH
jgi:glyoxylase-like metal-dependent hydrolase (beta-lactamase superfamily II)